MAKNRYKNMGKDVTPKEENKSEGGIYNVYILVPSNTSPNGAGIVQVKIPNKKEIRRIKRQAFFVRRGLKRTIWYKNEYNDWQSISTRGPNVLSFAVQEIESREFVTDEGKKSKIILATGDFKPNDGLQN